MNGIVLWVVGGIVSREVSLSRRTHAAIPGTRGGASRMRPSLAWISMLLLCWGGLPTSIESQRMPPDKGPQDLKAGEFVWEPELSPSGPVVVLVSIADQRLYAYRNGLRIGYSTVSTGKKGHETPTGVFTVLEKDANHVSNLYQGAKMPNMERLTWSGIALHAGNLPGYPASHGCVRLPLEFSKALYELDAIGTTVVIADDHDGPKEAAHPGVVLAPDLAARAPGDPAKAGEFQWRPERAPAGPVNVLLSSAERRLYVYRNGVEIGQAEVAFRGDRTVLPEGVFTVLAGTGTGQSPFAPDLPDHRWMGVPLGAEPMTDRDAKSALLSLVRIPADFGAAVYEVLMPGATIYVTNQKVAPHTSTPADFVVLATHDEVAG